VSLFDLTIRNIQKNFQTYFLYFVSMVFAILVFYMFNSIDYNEQVTRIVGEKMNFLLSFGSFLTAVFSAIFMGYSSAFFTRRRKREIGLYTLLGLKRKQVARMLFYENLVMGLVALGAGIFLGVLFSKLFAMLMLSLMGHYVQVDFFISPRAVLNTVVIFAIIFLVISWHTRRIIYRFQLVELFRAEQEGESQPQASLKLAFLSIALIAGGYIVALNTQLAAFFFPVYAVVVLGLVISGTYALFKSFSVFALQRLRRNQQHYYRGMNLISTSNLLYRIKSNATMLATIAVLSATTLTAVGMSYSFYFGMTENLKESSPFSYVYLVGGANGDSEVDATLAHHPQNKVLADVRLPYLEVKGEMAGREGYLHTAQLISESSYRELIAVRGAKPDIDLQKPGQAAVFYYANPSKMEGRTITVSDDSSREYQLQITDSRSYSLTNMMSFTLVVSDREFNQMSRAQQPVVMRCLLVDKPEQSAALTRELDENFDLLSSYFYVYRGQLETAGGMMFVGAFLGLVFLLATGSVIYFRQLNEAGKEQMNYVILRKIGVSRREIRASISRQVMVIFLFPLLVGVAHAVTALSALSSMLYKNLTIPIVITVATYTLVYLLYYLFTVHSYDNLVNLSLTPKNEGYIT